MATNNRYAPYEQYGDVELDCQHWEPAFSEGSPLEVKPGEMNMVWELVLNRTLSYAYDTRNFIERALAAGVVEEAKRYSTYRINRQFVLTPEGRERFARAGIK